jgi:hypothetical protein
MVRGKKKRTLSDEQKAKMKAGKEAKRLGSSIPTVAPQPKSNKMWLKAPTRKQMKPDVFYGPELPEGGLLPKNYPKITKYAKKITKRTRVRKEKNLKNPWNRYLHSHKNDFNQGTCAEETTILLRGGYTTKGAHRKKARRQKKINKLLHGLKEAHAAQNQ